jgi:nucleoside-diphosphate-sugar epimerase
MKKILITGACGYIGKQLIQKLLQQQVAILATDIVENQFVTENKKYTFLKADLRSGHHQKLDYSRKTGCSHSSSGHCFTH